MKLNTWKPIAVISLCIMGFIGIMTWPPMSKRLPTETVYQKVTQQYLQDLFKYISIYRDNNSGSLPESLEVLINTTPYLESVTAEAKQWILNTIDFPLPPNTNLGEQRVLAKAEVEATAVLFLCEDGSIRLADGTILDNLSPTPGFD